MEKTNRLTPGSGGNDLLGRCLGSAGEALGRNRRLILLCLMATLVWGLLTHSYMFAQSSFSHDSLNEFNADVYGNAWKIELGRIFVPAYRFLARGSLTLPWLIGMLSLLYISAAVFLTVKVFDIRSGVLTVFIAGIYTANITVIATTATYIHDLDSDMLSLALSVLSVWLWKKYKKGFLFGMIPLCLSIGLYQSFLSVTITLVILYLVMELLDGETFARAFARGLKSVGMILGAGALYYLSMQLICGLTGIAIKSGDYNSVDTVLTMSIPEILRTTAEGYFQTVYKILRVASIYPRNLILAAHAGMIALAGLIILWRLCRKEIKIKEKLLTLVLIALLPIGMNVVYPLTGGTSHDLMEFGFWLVYLFVLLVAWWGAERMESWKPLWKQAQRLVSTLLVFLVLWGNVQTANTVYLKKDLEQQANLSLFTRIAARMEDVEGYVTGETSVVFVGTPETLLDTTPGFEPYTNITGCWRPYALELPYRERYRAYFDYILLNPIILAEDALWDRMQTDTRVADMPCYPEAESMAILDGLLVVKLGQPE